MQNRRRGRRRRKVCIFCQDKNLKMDYKDVGLMKKFISDRGKILPRRVSGNCAKHQRGLTGAIKRSRLIALIPFTLD